MALEPLLLQALDGIEHVREWFDDVVEIRGQVWFTVIG